MLYPFGIDLDFEGMFTNYFVNIDYVLCAFIINTSTNVTWHNVDDLLRQWYWVLVDMTITPPLFLSISSDTPHNVKIPILTDPIVCHEVFKSTLHFRYIL